MNYWKFNRTMLKRLLAWNLLNVFIGTKLSKSDDQPARGIGTQAAGWGLINIGIVALGIITTRRKQKKLEDPFDPVLMQKETNSLYRLLWINNRLNLFYIATGAWLAASKGADDPKMRGNGIGVMIQGFLLFVHDTIHAKKLKAERKAFAEAKTGRES